MNKLKYSKYNTLVKISSNVKTDQKVIIVLPIGTQVVINDVEDDGLSVITDDFTSLLIEWKYLDDWELQCIHSWREYIGFTDVYQYCNSCGYKRQ